ncbi:PTS transporter subunit IIC [Mesorhizobium loti]|uniref:PTS transporter subunit IIC n=1 Tax=Rhizobium loti TaxID=381 RepID=UPI0003F6F39E|nr:PTS transporter subunit IIC [Mesorhizobium loti]
MDTILAGPKGAIDTLGPTILLPIVIFIIAVILDAKVSKAFRAAVTIGVAFIGINLVLGLMFTSIGDVAKAIVTNTGIHRDIIDVGWPSAAAIAFGSSVGLWVIPVGILFNIVLLLTRMTRTLNVDVWNFWHFAFVGSLVVAATDNLAYGIAVAAFSLLFADWSARAVQQFYGVPGISVPHLASAQILVPIAIILSIILPGNRVILFADLAVIPFIVAMAAPLVKGNVFRMVVIGTVTLAIGFYVANALAPLFTSAAVASGFKLPADALQITSVVDGFLWVPYVIIEAMGLGVVGIIVIAVVIAALFVLYRRNPLGWERAAGAEDEPAEGTA